METAGTVGACASSAGKRCSRSEINGSQSAGLADARSEQPGRESEETARAAPPQPWRNLRRVAIPARIAFDSTLSRGDRRDCPRGANGAPWDSLVSPRGSALVADHAEKATALFHVFRSLDAFRREAIDHSHDAAALLAFRDHGLHGIRSGAEDGTDLRHIF